MKMQKRQQMAKNNSDSTIKFLIYVLLFLIFVLLMLVLFIIPSIKNYKTTKSDFATFTSQNRHLSKKQVALHKSIETYKKEHAALLKSFATDFNNSQFINFSKKYFTNVTLSKGEVKDSKNQFREYAFKASSQSKTPVDFYRFIDDLENYPSVIKINFPITLVSKGKNIELSFTMSVYKTKK